MTTIPEALHPLSQLVGERRAEAALMAPLSGPWRKVHVRDYVEAAQTPVIRSSWATVRHRRLPS